LYSGPSSTNWLLDFPHKWEKESAVFANFHQDIVLCRHAHFISPTLNTSLSLTVRFEILTVTDNCDYLLLCLYVQNFLTVSL
jgi:hypothetical protein